MPTRPSEIAVVITIAIVIVRLRRSPAKTSRPTKRPHLAAHPVDAAGVVAHELAR